MKKFFILFFLTASIAQAEPQNLAFFRNKLVKYHDSGVYLQEFKQTLAHAKAYLQKRIVENNSLNTPKKLAIVLDIDETSLSNYRYMVEREFGGTHSQINQEIERGDAPALMPMLKFYHFARANNVAIFFVTGRKESQRNVTQENLKQQGYINYQGIYLKPNQYSQKSAIPYKSQSRAHIEEQGYDIVESIGDQYSDFKGGYTEKGFKLPNPYYYLP
jgi:acid phosphatase